MHGNSHCTNAFPNNSALNNGHDQQFTDPPNHPKFNGSSAPQFNGTNHQFNYQNSNDKRLDNENFHNAPIANYPLMYQQYPLPPQFAYQIPSKSKRTALDGWILGLSILGIVRIFCYL